ncbi:threonine synthase [Wukongibacter baidiensis]|uniref:threonine synthase n=1 Tax=Wukongibacter baidiensis TaxID=1723361 RepID=UPI003D7FB128
MRLICTKCNEKYPSNGLYYRCKKCNEPLQLAEVTDAKIIKNDNMRQSMLARYREFFPFEKTDDNISLGEGFTPLTQSIVLQKKLGVSKIYLKNESQNPTWSFKDRGTLVGIMHAKELGYRKIGTVSTGNMAPSVAAYGRRANLETFIFVKDDIAQEKLAPIAIYNPNLIRVRGDYGELYFKSLEIGRENDIYFINSDVPFRVEGSKTIAFEIAEQLGFNMPDYVIVPTSAGGNLRGILKGFKELKNCRYIEKVPNIVCAQSTGCSPIVTAAKNGETEISRVENPATIAHAIENPFPPSGNCVLNSLDREHFVSVNDDEIIQGQKLLAEEGVFVQPASAVTVAAIRKLKEQRVVTGNETIVCIVTGSGLKYPTALKSHKLEIHTSNIDRLSSYVIKNFK